LLAAVVFGAIVTSEVGACHVTHVDLYVTDDEDDAEETENTDLVLCGPGLSFWVRVEWSSGGPGETEDNPFDVRMLEKLYDYEELWEVQIEDERPYQYICEMDPFDIPRKHKLYAEVRRVGTSSWKRSDCSLVIDGDEDLNAGAYVDMPRQHTNCPWLLMCTGTNTITDWCDNQLRLRCDGFSGCSSSGCAWQFEYKPSTSTSWTNVGVCVWKEAKNDIEYKRTLFPCETLFLRADHDSAHRVVGTPAPGEGCVGWYCWMQNRYYCVDGSEVINWYRQTQDFQEGIPSCLNAPCTSCPGSPGTHICYGVNP
jgi:hypothetical protein